MASPPRIAQSASRRITRDNVSSSKKSLMCQMLWQVALCVSARDSQLIIKQWRSSHHGALYIEVIKENRTYAILLEETLTNAKFRWSLTSINKDFEETNPCKNVYTTEPPCSFFFIFPELYCLYVKNLFYYKIC